jgi:uroporphyrinogen III methyltransferase/synthase
MNAVGRVFLVGAGPGDPGLLTLKGLWALERAQVVVYDHLISRDLLELAPETAERIYVGKEVGAHSRSQDQINELLADRALQGKTVVRLKGGDPFIFGRGGEEAEHLAARSIPFEVIPGVSAATAVPAYAGIPLTYRGAASSFVVLTGHEDPGKEASSTRWAEVARGVDTLVFLMAMTNLPLIARRLMQHGRSPEDPAALIRWGTTADQQTVVGTLRTIVADAERAGLTPPAVLVVGEVVRLRERALWFEKKPLFGKRIVVTRPRREASRFARLLEDAGAEVLRVPTIRIEPPESWDQLDRALEEIEQFRWVIFTSVNGVESFRQRLELAGKDVRSLRGARLAAIGPETAERLRRWGLIPDAIPREYRAEGLVELLKGQIRPSERILLPRAAEARELLVGELERAGARVTEVPVYRTRPAKEETDRLRRELEAGRIHAVTFTSSSTARNFAALFSREERRKLLSGVIFASIGPVTAETAAQHGFETRVMPSEYTIPALAQAIIDYFTQERSG